MCKFSFYFKPFGAPLQAHIAVLLFILCGIRNDNLCHSIFRMHVFYISALTFLAKCDLVCVKLKKKSWINWCQIFCTITISPFIELFYWKQSCMMVLWHVKFASAMQKYKRCFKGRCNGCSVDPNAVHQATEKLNTHSFNDGGLQNSAKLQQSSILVYIWFVNNLECNSLCAQCLSFTKAKPQTIKKKTTSHWQIKRKKIPQ